MSRDLHVVNSPVPAWLGVNSFRCTCLPNLEVTDLIEMEIPIHTPILTWIPQKKAKFTASIRYIEKFLESGIAIYNVEVPDMPGRKTRKIRRTRSCKALCSRKHIKTIFVYWLDNLTYWYHQLEMVKWKVLGILLSILLLIENWIISYYKMKSFLYQNISICNKVQ